ncbi:MAG TPA: tRNA (adenosine(37)-N6)-dimethylallyltransferase MiaA, partial [Candidatus Azoamicus sp.]
MNDKILFFLLGPTCVGKTNLSLKLFDYFPFEIVNVDSSMIYKFMDIGTGKPCFNIRNKIKHHLIDIKMPIESYSVWDFCLDAFYA